jgi:hypothetical protein
MDPEDWQMGELAAQDGYMPPETFGPTNVIDRRSFVPNQPFEQPTDEEMFQYELHKKMMGEPMLPGEGRGPPPELNPQPEPTGDDELDDARGGLRPLTREELDAFQAQMQMDVPTSRELAMMMGRPYDPWGLRESAENRLDNMKLERLGMAAPEGGIGSILRPSTPQGGFDDELRAMRGWEPRGLDDLVRPAYPMDDLDVRRRR